MALQQLSARVPCIQLSQVGSWASDSAREPHPLKSRWREPCHSFLQGPQAWCTGGWEWEMGMESILAHWTRQEVPPLGPSILSLWWEWKPWWFLNPPQCHSSIILKNNSSLLLRWLIFTNLHFKLTSDHILKCFCSWQNRQAKSFPNL